MPEEILQAPKEKSEVTYTVDSFANGIAFGSHKLEAGSNPRDVYALSIHEEGHPVKLRSRYLLNRHSPLYELEHHLMRLARQGVLRDSKVYFGVSTDPFLPFEGKFDASMKFLEIFKKYTPGHLAIQTRSPLVVIALPVLKKLGKNASVTIGIETPKEEMVRDLTPALPRVAERLKAASALRRFGIEVTIQVGPVLPYGDWKNDAGAFAELLCEHGDYIYVKPLTDGTEIVERRIRNSPLAKRLAKDRLFQWLRQDAATPLITAIEKIAPDKLGIPRRSQLLTRQLEIFAA